MLFVCAVLVLTFKYGGAPTCLDSWLFLEETKLMVLTSPLKRF